MLEMFVDEAKVPFGNLFIGYIPISSCLPEVLRTHYSIAVFDDDDNGFQNGLVTPHTAPHVHSCVSLAVSLRWGMPKRG